MKMAVMLGLMVIAGLGTAYGAIASFHLDRKPGPDELLPAPREVTVSWADGAMRVDYDGNEAVSVPLVRVPLEGIREPYQFQARLKTQAASLAYLEMWSMFPSGEYFSRALNQPLSGDTGWTMCTTPFFLRDSDPSPISATLGVRMEGPGTVWIDDLMLEPLGQVPANRNGGRFWGMAGGVVGTLGGLWGAAIGVLAPRGRGKRTLIAVGFLFLAAGVAALLWGVWLVATGAPAQASPALTFGLVDTAVVAGCLVMVRRRFEEYELRRMRAMDSV